MYTTIIIAGLSCLALIVTITVKPEINIKGHAFPLYPLVALAGAVLLLVFSPLSLSDCVDGIVGAGAVNPLKILVLFLCLTGLSVFLDETGFFEYLAWRILSRSGNKQTRLFFLFYTAVSVLTVFTSNDIIILTFTPFVIYFCQRGGIKAFPYLMAEFVAANTWSMALVIGNPTNVYLATAAGITFFEYVKIMILPTLAAGIISAGVLYLLFHKSLAKPFVGVVEEKHVKDLPMCIVGGTILLLCTVFLAVSSYIGAEMWLVCAVAFGTMIVLALVISLARRHKPNILARMFCRLPYALVPFILSMFILSLALDKVGATLLMAQFLSADETVLYGIASFLCTNLMNNIPMSILFSSVIAAGQAGRGAVYATVVGSNLGAILTPIGALAGIMFSAICKKHGEKISTLQFVGHGAVISVASLATTLSVLAVVLYLM